MSLDVVDKVKECVDAEEFWSWFFRAHFICSIAYSLLFYGVYRRAVRAEKSPKDALGLSTCTISTVHSVICVVGFVVGVYHDELYKEENRLISPPGIIAAVWMQWNSYMITDLLGHLVVFWVNSMPPRYDLIVHHVVAYSVVYCLMFPLPIYGWDWLCLPLIAEFSTIFMNLRWFTKHFAFSDRVQRRMDALFAITWFGTRCPAMAGMLALRFVLHHRIVNELPPRVHIAGTVIIVFINLLHVVWGLFLAKKMMKSRAKRIVDKEIKAEPDKIESLLKGQSARRLEALKEGSDEKEGVDLHGRDCTRY